MNIVIPHLQGELIHPAIKLDQVSCAKVSIGCNILVQREGEKIIPIDIHNGDFR